MNKLRRCVGQRGDDADRIIAKMGLNGVRAKKLKEESMRTKS